MIMLDLAEEFEGPQLLVCLEVDGALHPIFNRIIVSGFGLRQIDGGSRLLVDKGYGSLFFQCLVVTF